MLGDKEFNQENSGPGPSYQAESMSFGLSYADTKQIALDLWKDNALKLSQEATQTALTRVNEFLDSFLSKINEIDPELLNTLKEPSMQMVLFAAQRDYAKTGDKDLENLLVKLLIERAKNQEKTLLQLTIDESLLTVAKLTQNQLNIISLSWILGGKLLSGDTDDKLSYVIHIIIKLSAELPSRTQDVWHLDYCRCLVQHTGLFRGGSKWVEPVNRIHDLNPAYFKPIPNQTGNILNDAIIIKDFMIEKWPGLSNYFETYDNYKFHTLYLTTVGRALALSNIKYLFPEFTDDVLNLPMAIY
jgi:hypothetical protein